MPTQLLKKPMKIKRIKANKTMNKNDVDDYSSLQDALEKNLRSEKTLNHIAVKFTDSNIEKSSLTYRQLKAA